MVGGRSSPPTAIETTAGVVADPGPDEYGEVRAVPVANSAIRRVIDGASASKILRRAASDGDVCGEVRALGLRVLFDPWMVAERAAIGVSTP